MSRTKALLLAVVFCTTALYGAPTIVGNLKINNTFGGNYPVGQAWELTLAGGQPDAAFGICASWDMAPPVCLDNFGRTDQNGSWKLAGNFDAASVGGWTEWLRFPSGAVSNRISFTVGNAIMGNLAINSAAGGNFAVGQTWTLALTGAAANASFDICSTAGEQPATCVPNFGTVNPNGSWTMSGTFPESAAGGWTEWLRFPSGAVSNRISFTVGNAISYLAYGFNLGPYIIPGQDPNTGIAISEAQLTALISRIAPFTRWIRTYGSTNGLEIAGKIAHQFGLKVAMGIWLNNNDAANQLEIASGVAAYQNGHADILIVGSEVLYRQDLTESELVAYISQVRRAVPGAIITTADTITSLLNHPNAAAACDIIFANDFPYWDGKNISQAMASLHANYQSLKSRYPQKEIIIAETGWPSGGNAVGNAVPSSQNSAAYFLNFVSWARALNQKYFYFEAFDEAWKTAYEGPQGGTWGVWDGNGTLKTGMLDVFGGKTVPDNWSDAGQLLPGGPGAPSIQFTSVPPKGSGTDLKGQVLHVKPGDYYVAVYIRVRGGWWTKPYWNSPKTSIDSDGTWVCDITTGGVDEEADQITAYVLPNNYNPILASGDAYVPNPGTIAVASATVGR